MKAIVFAYHNVGVRCLKVLLARGVDVALVVTHEDHPHETIWFDSVTALCREHNITSITPTDPASPELLAHITALQPDVLFSFYYRHMLPANLLTTAKYGAYNMHGSLLPKYRGRVPINWAVLHGETETGATLHEMVTQPDAGAIIAQTLVPILPDDTAYDVFGKVVVAAEQTLWKVLPAILAGNPPKLPNELTRGSYFSGRKPEDGQIDWHQSAQQVYNLYRAVAPPYPGAWTKISNTICIIEKARLIDNLPQTLSPGLPLGLTVVDNHIFGICGDGRALLINALLADGQAVTPQQLNHILAKSSRS